MSAPDVREAAVALLDVLAKIEDAPNRYIAAAISALRAALAAPVSPPAPRGEAVAWGIMRKDGTLLGNRTWTSRLGADLELNCLRTSSPRVTNAEGFRVVALVPQHEEPAT